MAKDKADAAGIDQEVDAVKAVLKVLDGLSVQGKEWVLRTVSDRLSLQVPPGPGSQAAGGGAPPPGGRAATKTGTAKQFLAAKRPETDVERVACLAYYLTHSINTPHFKTRDITSLNTEAAGSRFSNAAATVRNATNQSGFLAAAGGGKKQITPHGEDVVNALPDREKVQALLAAHAPAMRRRRKKRGKRRATP
jgi:hypothetical protein